MHIGKDDFGGVRKLFQDLLAPELGGIKARISSVEENITLLRDEIKAMEARLVISVATAVRESYLSMRLAESEKRNSELERRLASGGTETKQ